MTSTLNVYDDDFTDAWEPPDPVVIVGGFARNGKLWRGWVPYLGRRHRVLRIDLPGCGRSPDPGPKPPFSHDYFATRILEVLDDRGIERAHYIGEGLGGVIGTYVAGAHPDRIISLTAMTLPFTVDAGIAHDHAVGFSSWEEALKELGTRGWWWKCRETGGDLTGNRAMDEYVADEIGLTPPHVAIALSHYARSWSQRDLLPKVKAPVLLVWAEDAFFVPKKGGDIDHYRKERDVLTSLASNGRQWLVPKMKSQFYPFYYPDSVAPEVARFIDSRDNR